MAPRAYWKGFLRLSLVSCPIQLFPATSEREKVSFNQINAETGNRIRYRKVDEHSGEEVEQQNIVKAYQVEKGHYIEISDEELEAVALESKKTIEIDEFVPRSEIDELYYMRPYYVVPDGDVGQEAFAVIRESIAKMDKVAIGRVVLTTREHVIAMEPRGKGLMGTLLRYPYEVRDEKEYFDDIPNIKVKKDMLDLAQHIVETKSGHFEPESFEDHYEADREEIERYQDRGAEARRARQGHQSHGCLAQEHPYRAGRRQKAREGEARQEARRGSARNAVCDSGQETGERGGKKAPARKWPPQGWVAR
jgi:DNA end-binding protein Ku